jgi:hypothetical protein
MPVSYDSIEVSWVGGKMEITERRAEVYDEGEFPVSGAT